MSLATISRYLTKAGLVTPQPKKRPKSSFIRFEADLPNQCWQADVTHYRLTNPDGSLGADVEILCWLDDHSRYALSVTADSVSNDPQRHQAVARQLMAKSCHACCKGTSGKRRCCAATCCYRAPPHTTADLERRDAAAAGDRQDRQ